MITGQGYEIRKTDPHRTKYGDAMAEYLDGRLEWASEESGDVECPTGHFTRFGRRILVTDDRGFVWVEKWATTEKAERVYSAMDQFYWYWADEEMEEDNPTLRIRLMEASDHWLRAVAADKTVLPFEQWLVDSGRAW